MTPDEYVELLETVESEPLNLADVCVAGGGALFLAAVRWILWRIPDERFARPLLL